MALRQKRVVRPMKALPRAVPIVPPKPEELPTLREFLAQLVRESNEIGGTDVFGNTTLPLPRTGSYPVFIPVGVGLSRGRPGHQHNYVERAKLGPNLWPKTFDLKFDNLVNRHADRVPINPNKAWTTDYDMSHAVHDAEAEYAYVQSVTIDPKLKVPGIRISGPIHITEDFKRKICVPNVRHKIFALASLMGRVEIYPISPPNARLVSLLTLYHDRFKTYPKVVIERVGEYEK